MGAQPGAMAGSNTQACSSCGRAVLQVFPNGGSADTLRQAAPPPAHPGTGGCTQRSPSSTCRDKQQCPSRNATRRWQAAVRALFCSGAAQQAAPGWRQPVGPTVMETEPRHSRLCARAANIPGLSQPRPLQTLTCWPPSGRAKSPSPSPPRRCWPSGARQSCGRPEPHCSAQHRAWC